jgi:hypothetical protein
MAAAQPVRVQRLLKAWLPVVIVGVRATLGAAVIGSGGSVSVAVARLALGSALTLAVALTRRLATHGI